MPNKERVYYQDPWAFDFETINNADKYPMIPFILACGPVSFADATASRQIS
jgi:hypothetical protein